MTMPTLLALPPILASLPPTPPLFPLCTAADVTAVHRATTASAAHSFFRLRPPPPRQLRFPNRLHPSHFIPAPQVPMTAAATACSTLATSAATAPSTARRSATAMATKATTTTTLLQ